MRIRNLLIVAYRSLSRNKLRTFLTMLGIIIGVASVIAMLAIGEGSKQNIQASISSLGTNSVMIIPGAITQGGVHLEAGSQQSLTREDAEAIALKCDAVKYISPVVQSGAQVIAGSQNWKTMVLGVFPDYFFTRNLIVQNGNIFNKADDRAAAKVCIIGLTVVTNLFGEDANPVGQTIRINRIPFKIIGVLEKKGQNTFGQDQDDVVLAPFATVQKRMLSTTNVHMIIASAQSEEQIEEAKEQISQLIRVRHKIANEDDDDLPVFHYL